MSATPRVAAALVLLVLLALLPGAALLRATGSAKVDRRADPLVEAGLAAGLGLALVPLVALWADTVGLPLHASTWWVLLGLAGLPLVLLWLPRARSSLRAWGARRADAGRGMEGAATVATLILLTALLAARWWAARDVSVPLWGDSVHHAMIVELFARQAGLPDDWLPLAQLRTFTYHFGLHAVTSAVAALSGLPSHRALVVTGQGLMVLQALTAYALVAGLTGRRWAGFGAALAAAGLGEMPGHYLNWGRYTQLAGQVLLPVAALATVRATAAWPSRGDRRRLAGAVLVAAVLVAGLALTHYLVTLFFVLLVAALWLVGLVGPEGAPRRRLTALPPLAGVAAAALLLAGPWVPRFLGGRLDEAAAALVTSELPDERVWGVPDPSYVWGNLQGFVGWPLLAAMAVAAAWLLARSVVARRSAGAGPMGRPWRVALAGLLWMVLQLAAAYPALLGVPVTGPIKDFTVFIALYLPAGLLVGPLVGAAAAAGSRMAEGRANGARVVARAAGIALALALAVAVPWGDRNVQTSEHRLVTADDERALAWLAEHTPPDARILVSAAPAYGGSVVAGEDGGWWVPLLAGRRSTLPPITYGLEPGVQEGYREAVNALNARWREDLDAPETVRALRQAGVGWAYVGPRARTLRPSALERSPHWRLVHQEGDARIFRASWAEP